LRSVCRPRWTSTREVSASISDGRDPDCHVNRPAILPNMDGLERLNEFRAGSVHKRAENIKFSGETRVETSCPLSLHWYNRTWPRHPGSNR
jgi:hypothetical protein